MQIQPQLHNVLCCSNQVDTDLLCQVDAKPSLSPADRVVFHVKLPGDDHFVETESNIVFSSDIIEGSLYKCVFYEESSDTSYESGNIYLIKGIICFLSASFFIIIDNIKLLSIETTVKTKGNTHR